MTYIYSDAFDNNSHCRITFLTCYVEYIDYSNMTHDARFVKFEAK